ncbi:tRNA lysidine(34) synthetase TilS [Patescibacteria group bacterium]|nr:tRNA lysidine(34) synthetase TilS [Patescibacteria group bacterium]
MELVEHFRQKLEANRRLILGKTLVVGVSGGVDSVSLLKLLVLLSGEYKLKLVVAHFNHGLRKVADMDAKFVKELAASFGLEFLTIKADIKKLAKKQKLTIEEAGRVWRYIFLKQLVIVAHKGDLVVTAHTADDQVETVIMNWLRGAGVRGLAGMKELENKIWRPLLAVSKEEIKKFAKDQKLKYREDSSNKQTKYTRNRIRHQLIPYLSEFNSNIKVAMLRTAATFTELEDFLDQEIAITIKKVVISKKTNVYVNLRLVEFNKLSAYLKNEILLWAIEIVKGNKQDYKKVHLEQMLLVIDTPKGISEKQLPGKLWLLKNRGRITISRVPRA